jgi:4'-phosphopantetheinyl transferase
MTLPGHIHRLEDVLGVAVYRVALDVPGIPEAPLAPEEVARRARFAIERDARRFATARAALRVLLAAETGTAAEDLVLVAGASGKPALARGPRFSLSRSGPIALVAVDACREVGVDVEQVRPVPDAEAIARRAFLAEERAELAEDRGGDAARAFLLAWTRKEAWLKALGVGLTLPGPPFDAARWTRAPLDVGPGAVASLVVARR